MSVVMRAVVVAGLVSVAAAGAGAQQGGGLAADLLRDVAQLERKFVGLAEAIPADKYAWSPAPPADSVRTVRQVLLHVGADNYFMPATIGHAPDPSTGIKGDDYNTGVVFERRALDKAQTIAELQKSFVFLKQALTATPAEKMGEQVTMFGQSFTRQQAWILAVTHVHEHLGQLIAYARSNGVKPPWS